MHFSHYLRYLWLVSLFLLAACARQAADDLPPAVTAVATADVPAPTSAPPADLPPPLVLEQAIPPPQLTLTGHDGSVAGQQQPAFMAVELAGLDIAAVSQYSGRNLGDGRRQLLNLEPVLPQGGSDWQAGVFDLQLVWPGTGHLLTAGSRQLFVLAWPIGTDSERLAVNGRLTRAASGQTFEAVLQFGRNDGQLWQVADQAAGRALTPSGGDTFQLFEYEFPSLTVSPGAVLTLTEAPDLRLTVAPLPGDDYFLGFNARSEAGETANLWTDLTVNNDGLLPGYRAYLDPELGFQFLYPQEWPAPRYEQPGRLVSRAGQLQLTVTVHPDLAGRTIDELRQQVLDAFGRVDILYDDQVPVGAAGGGGLRTVYAYSGSEGERTGQFTVFARDGIGYVVDLEGTAADELAVVTAAQVLNESWVFRPFPQAAGSGRWQPLQLGQLALPIPIDFRQNQLENGWLRLSPSQGAGFLALRSETADGGNDAVAFARRWTNLADNGTADFNAGVPYSVTLGLNPWSRIDFAYTTPAETVTWGTIMAAVIDGQAVILWLEAPQEVFPALQEEVLLLMAAAVGND